jgi:hypothetical protein
VTRGGDRGSLMFRLGCALLEFYPRAYRARYGEELRVVLEQCPVTMATLFDLMLGALDAHLASDGVVASPLSRMRGAISASLTLWLALILVGAGFAKTTEDAPFRAAEAAHPLLGASRIAVAVLGLVAAGIVVVAGAPIALSILKQAWIEGSRSLRRAVIIPLLGIALYGVATGALVLVAGQGHGNGSLLGHLVFLVWLGLAVVVAGVCAVCARVAIERARLHLAALGLAACSAWLLARVIAALTAAMALYSVLLAVYAGRLQGLPNGPLSLPTSVVLAGEVAAMVVISAIALPTASRGMRRTAMR